MYTRKEYEQRIEELHPVAREIVATKTPDEARGIISKMNAEDAYIMGMWLGKMLVLDELAHAVTNVVVKIEKRSVPNVSNLN